MVLITKVLDGGQSVRVKVDQDGRIEEMSYKQGTKWLTISSSLEFDHNFERVSPSLLQEIMLGVGSAIEGHTGNSLDGFLVAATDMFKPHKLTMFHKGSCIKEMPVIGQVLDGECPTSPTSSIASESE
jgi:hypothetical protein